MQTKIKFSLHHLPLWVGLVSVAVALAASSMWLKEMGYIAAQRSSADSVVIALSPNPIQICNVGGVGSGTFTWNVPTGTNIELRRDSQYGSLIRKATNSGSFVYSSILAGDKYVLYKTVTATVYQWNYIRGRGWVWGPVTTTQYTELGRVTAAATTSGCGVTTPPPPPGPTPPPPTNNVLPIGYFDNVTCEYLYGWAYDANTPTQSIDVHIYDGNTFVTFATANLASSDLAFPGNHRYQIATPARFKDGQSHTVRVYAIDSTGGPNPELTWSPRTISGCSSGGSVTTGNNTFSVGAPEIVVSKQLRDSKGLNFWPDGFTGVQKRSDGSYDFFAANSTKSAMTRGSLSNPVSSVLQTASAIQNPKAVFDYASGGPVYKDAASGKLIKIYHAEKWVSPPITNPFHSWLGMAVSSDNGLTWTDLGTIIKSQLPLSQHVEIGGGSFFIKDGYMYVYYHDYLSSGVSLTVSVARTSLSEISAAVQGGRAPVFKKYLSGAWNSDALTGSSTPLFSPSTPYGWPTVSYNSAIGKYVMIMFKYADFSLWISTSSDGVNWSSPSNLNVTNATNIYPTIIGTGDDPLVTGGSFYIYYTQSTTPDVWQSAVWVRRPISVQ